MNNVLVGSQVADLRDVQIVKVEGKPPETSIVHDAVGGQVDIGTRICLTGLSRRLEIPGGFERTAIINPRRRFPSASV